MRYGRQGPAARDKPARMTPDEAALAAFAALRRRDWAGAIEAADALRAPDRPALEARAAVYCV